MKIVNKPLEVIVWFTDAGAINPLRFKVNSEDDAVVVKIDQILTRSLEKLAGNKMLVYRCQSSINGLEKTYELKYELDTCKWYLFKI